MKPLSINIILLIFSIVLFWLLFILFNIFFFFIFLSGGIPLLFKKLQRNTLSPPQNYNLPQDTHQLRNNYVKICSKCGAKIEINDAKYCYYCSTKI